MQVKEIAELIEIIERSAIEEFELERSGVRIRVRKSSPNSTTVVQTALSASSPAASEPAPTATPAGTGESIDEKPSNLYVFKAPIVGTNYLAPKPDAEPFVKVGDRVSKGTVLCIIEAMKIFNQIESDVDGVITRILVENGQPVEYGEPLFEIQLDS